MKILYLHQYFNTPDMFGGTRSYEMARRLVSMGHEVHMVTSWRESSTHKTWFNTDVDGIHVHWLPVKYSNKMSFYERIKAFFMFAVLSARKATSIKSDIVFATSTPLTIALPAVYVVKKQKIPMVFEVRDLWPELPITIGALKNPLTRWLAIKLEHFAYKNSDSVVALSPGMQMGVVKLGYQSIEQVAMIPNSCDLELFSADNVDGNVFVAKHPELIGRPIILYAGTFGLINGVGYAVDLAKAALTIHNKVCFVLIGGGAEFELVRQKAIDAGVLGNNLFIYPALSKKEMPHVLAAADIAMSLFIDIEPMWTNSANKFFDALASGTPVAINYGGWQKDLLSEANAGIVLDARDIQKAAHAIINKVLDEKWKRTASVNALNLAEEQFSRDDLAKKLEMVLAQVLSQYKV